MCGRRTCDDTAQLALLDAMVFFAVSALICSVMISAVESSVDRERADVPARVDPSGLLQVFLAASLGEGVRLEGAGLELTGREQFGETLLAVGGLVRSGLPAGLFEEFLSHCARVLDVLCPHAYAPWLQVLSEEPMGWALLYSVGAAEPDHSEAISSYQNLAGGDGTRVMVILALSPTLLPHLVQV